MAHDTEYFIYHVADVGFTLLEMPRFGLCFVKAKWNSPPDFLGVDLAEFLNHGVLGMMSRTDATFENGHETIEILDRILFGLGCSKILGESQIVTKQSANQL